ncbi:hypothetical protein SSS_02029 [Sarcoptes scabiei]|uniref:Uncharacterized protein n=1 Tax=Sarcoptes scabiei TaxID=52283 RepID=A0A834REZ0_SARSC|nr:hypothetical protein SSS_02029 [Sarcoptes scabiei]
MPEQTSRFYSFRSVTETFVSIDELKSQLIRLRAVNSETIRMSSSSIAYFQAIERHLDHLKTLLSSVEELFLEKFRMDFFNSNSLDEIIALFCLLRSESLRNHSDRCGLINTIVAMDRTQLSIASIFDIYQQVYANCYNSIHFYLGLVQNSYCENLVRDKMASNPDDLFLYNPYYVEQYFLSIRRLRESLRYLRRYISNIAPFGFLEDFDTIDRCLESLESAMIAGEEELIGQTFRVRPVEILLRPDLENFVETVLRAHHERIRLARTIEAINPVDINLSVAIEHYRVVLYQLNELSHLFPQIHLGNIYRLS